MRQERTAIFYVIEGNEPAKFCRGEIKEIIRFIEIVDRGFYCPPPGGLGECAGCTKFSDPVQVGLLRNTQPMTTDRFQQVREPC